VGVDGISVLFVMLTTFLMPITIAACWGVTHRVKEYMIAMLVLETLMIGVFVALDLVLFYLFFEAGLIPMFLIIGIWGGKDRIYASFKFFLYTFLGSVLMLVAMVAMFVDAGTTDIEQLLATSSRRGRSPAGLADRGRHADAAVAGLLREFRGEDADVAGAHLAARRARAGAHGGVRRAGGDPAEDGRLRLPAVQPADVPRGLRRLAPLVLWLSVIAIIYTSLVAMVQEDMKKLIAYSSVAHMGFVTMGIFAANQQGLDGAIFQMISHGFVSGALFLCVGVIYDRMHTREIDAYGGLVVRMPAYAAIFMLFTMANVGLPGTSGLRRRIPDADRVFQVNTWIGVLAATGVILSAAMRCGSTAGSSSAT
jgi:NADH-quinone oxidoreductase subunit M